MAIPVAIPTSVGLGGAGGGGGAGGWSGWASVVREGDGGEEQGSGSRGYVAGG